MSWHLKRSMWAATLERYPSSFKNSPDDRERSPSLSRRPARPFLRRPSTNGVTLQTVSGTTVSSLAVCPIPEVPRVTRTRSRSSDALIPWSRPRRHSFSESLAPGIHARHQALPLFTATRGHQRGMGISNSLIAVDVPDLSLRNTFSPPLLLKDSPKPLSPQDSPKTSTCAMCKYTIYRLDCGHAAEDHVDSKDCPYFQKTDVACDRDNPANRNRVTITSEDRNGLCSNCRRRQREIDELKAISREQEREKQQKLAEAEEARKASKAHEERLLKETAQEYARMQREQERKDMELALQQSREAAKAAEAAEAARLKKEQEDLARALKASQRKSASKKIPTPPPMPTQLPSPPATPIRTARSRPEETPAAPVDFSKPAGQQSRSIGHYTIGGRRAPIHDSQKEKATYFEMSSPATPVTPAAPVTRLGSGVQPGSPSPRQMPSMQASPMPGGDFRAGLRRTGGPRKSLPAQVVVDDGAELQAQLARRRTMEKISVEDMMAAYSVTPSESASNRQSRTSSPTGSNNSRVSRTNAPRNDSVYGEVELPSASALDEQRRKGWRKD